MQRAAASLEAWFAQHGRPLPWRRHPDPYRVLVAEFILQQTRMETGLRYYDAFLRRFPTLKSLARAPVSDVLRVWSGLGYYARARNLHTTARQLVRSFGGRVPEEAALLRTLPGIGPYTAGAIASIAYDRPEPALDGNQVRVLGRYFGLASTTPAMARRQMEDAARRLLVHGSPRRINQALMDLGSLVCLPEKPHCARCPLATGCRGRSRLQDRASKARPRVRSEHWDALVYRRGGRVWLEPPRTEGLLRGLWLPPLRPARRPLAHADWVHRFSHRTWRLRWVRARTPPRGPGRWVGRNDLEKLPHSRLTAHFVAAALQPQSKP